MAWVVESRLTRAWQHVPRGESDYAYMSCCVGEQRQLSYVPEALLCSDAAPGGEREALLQLGVFTFVAARI